MKNNTLLIFMAGLLSFFPVFAQNETADIQELLNRMQENHMGSLDDVFNTEELQTLQSYFNTVNPPDTENLLLPSRRFSSTKGNTPVSVATIDVQDITSIQNHGPSSITEFEGAGIAIALQNRAYVVDNSNRVYIRGIQNNNYTQLGTISNVPGGESITGMERLSNGNVYAISTNGMNSSHLLMIDTNNWNATPMGGNNGLVVPIALARDGADRLVTVDIDDDNAYLINAATGAPTLMGSIGFDANFGQGMGYDPDAGKVLLTAFNNTLGDSELREMNTTTGLTVSLGTITPGVIDQFGYGSYYDADLLDLQQTKASNFNYYPNPVEDILSIRSKSPVTQIDIYSVDGEKVLSHTLGRLTAELDMRILASGFYLMQVVMEGEIFTYKILKK
jgi:hypothetical protein